MEESSKKLLHPSQYDARRSLDAEASDFESDLDMTEALDSDPLNPSAEPKTATPAGLQRYGSTSLRLLAIRSKIYCFAALAALAVAWVFLASGGLFAYKKYNEAPPDGQSPPWYPSPKGGTVKSWAQSYKKAAVMVEKMTLAEKVNITTGTGWSMGLAVGTTGPAEKVGFPQLILQDGPLGLRFADNATAFPAGITVGATWNKELMYNRGEAHAAEAKAKGIHVILGPCVGPLGRMPAAGRNWEGFGADPYLQGIAAAETIKGIQSQGVQATIKHFVANEQEHFRQSWEWGLPNAMSANIGDRAMHELYAWPFGDAIKAGVASVMCSYNMVNNSYACGNSKLMNGILKDEMGFQGYVMSDWLAQRSGVASALAGLDMTMPGDGLRWQDGKSLWGPEMSKAVLNGSLPVDRLNDMVTRIVASWYQLGQDADGFPANEGPNFSSWTNDKMGVMAPGSPTPQDVVEVNQYVNVQGDHKDIARRVAAEGIVMLKNTGILPLSKDGKAAPRLKEDGPLRIGIFGEDAGPGEGPNYCKDRGCNQGTLGSGWGSGAVEFPYLVPPVDGLKSQFDAEEVNITEFLTNSPPFQKEKWILEQQDICMVFANADSGEGFMAWGSVGGDRPDIFLQKGGDDLIVQVANECGGGRGSTIVVIHAVGPVVMERWVDLPGVKAVLLANLPGQESGNALADVVFGDVGPSGHLPYTIGKSLQDYGPAGQILYLPNGVIPQQNFDEGIFIDYRHFDKEGIEPRFEFGYGLSYAKFDLSNIEVKTVKEKSEWPAPRPAYKHTPPEYSTKIPDKSEVAWPTNIRKLATYIYPYLGDEDLDYLDEEGRGGEGGYPYPDGYDVVQPPSGAGGDEGGNPDLWEIYVNVTVLVTNTGSVLAKGKAVPQLYLSYPAVSGVEFPVRQLRGFEKIELGVGEGKRVTFSLTRRDLSYWDVVSQNWRMVTEGEYKFVVGFSSRDERISTTW